MGEVESIFGNDIPDSLEDLAALINAEHRQCERAFKSGFEHAFRAGELLFYAKADLAHGEWLPWLKENFDGSVRTAQSYIRVWRDRGALQQDAQRVAHLTLRGALKELSQPESESDKPSLLGPVKPIKLVSGEDVSLTPAEPPSEPIDDPQPVRDRQSIDVVETRIDIPLTKACPHCNGTGRLSYDSPRESGESEPLE